jgi:hypothetical protein
LLSYDAMSRRCKRPPLNQLVSATIFSMGCLGMCGMLILWGPEGFAPGYAIFGLCFIAAMEAEHRLAGRGQSGARNSPGLAHRANPPTIDP